MRTTDPGAFHTCDFRTRQDLWLGIMIGSIVLVRDENRRIYDPPEEGRIWSSGGPHDRGFFRRMRVVNETSRSWVLSDKRKISKKTLKGVYSNLCADQWSWISKNSYKIVEGLRIRIARREPEVVALLNVIASTLKLKEIQAYPVEAVDYPQDPGV